MAASFSRDLGSAIAQHGRLQFIHFGLSGRGLIIRSNNPAQEARWVAEASELLRRTALGIIGPARGDRTGGAMISTIALWAAFHGHGSTANAEDLLQNFTLDNWQQFEPDQLAFLSQALLTDSDSYIRALASHPSAEVPEPERWQQFVQVMGLTDYATLHNNTAEDRIRLSFLAAGAKARMIAFDDVAGAGDTLYQTLGAI